jgi:Zn-dependent M28 family amino/carboxypeptidase
MFLRDLCVALASFAAKCFFALFQKFISNSPNMQKLKAPWLCFILSTFCLATTPPAETDDAARIIHAALQPSSLESNLRHLTDEVGGRVPGTPAMQRAVDWGVQMFKAAGADSVHTEEFTIQHSWAEGATEMTVSSTGTALDPKLTQIPRVEFRVHCVSIAWAPALAAVKHVPMIDVGKGSPADFAKAGDISGKIVLVHSTVLKTWDDLFAEYSNAPPVIAAAVKGKARGVAFIATREHDILYRHTNTVQGEIDLIPQVLVAREDGERIGRLLVSGHPVWADLSIPSELGGPIKTTNVIAEIKGSEKPQEFVILGAHLDSWELGTGALDNGCNAALVVDALRAVKASGLKPRRSIRFILFSGEEEGLLGSRAYATAHRSELDNAAGVIIYDAGTGKTTGFADGGRKDVLDTAKRLIAPLQQFGVTELKTDMEWGTDHFDFMLEGVPTFVADQQEANYLENYHAVSDTYDKVDFVQLKKHVAEAAEFSFAMANLPQKIGPRFTRAQIEQSIHETHSDEMLKSAGLWDAWQSGRLGRQK